MLKPIPIIIGLSGVATVSTGGYFLLNRPKNEQVTTLTYESVDAFKDGAKNSECVKSYFGEIDVKTGGTVIGSDNPTNGTFFNADTEGTTTPYESCLVINWKKTEMVNDKWTGKFTWLWTFVRGDEGFINFTVAEPHTEAGKLKFTGVFYLVGKKTNPTTEWEVKYRKEVTDTSKTADKEQVENYLPKPHTDLTEATQLFWGFMSGKEDLAKICTGDSCPSYTDPSTTHKLKWTSTTSGDKKLKDWSTNLTWWTSIYGITPWSLDTKIESFTGTWALSPQS